MNARRHESNQCPTAGAIGIGSSPYKSSHGPVARAAILTIEKER
jgi:hypothetical protein